MNKVHAMDGCPICGKPWKYGGAQPGGHHCRKRVFSGIDARETRSEEPHEFSYPENGPRARRLKDGLQTIYGYDMPYNR